MLPDGGMWLDEHEGSLCPRLEREGVCPSRAFFKILTDDREKGVKIFQFYPRKLV